MLHLSPLSVPLSPSGPAQVDTKLFDLDCASSLLDMLRRGIVQLKRPGGQGLLRLYSDNEVLDEWSAGGGRVEAESVLQLFTLHTELDPILTSGMVT